MVDYIKVSANGISNDAERIKALTDSAPQLMKELEQAMYTLNECWEGAAWNAYQNTSADYIEILEEIYEYYGKYITNLHQASQTYTRAEQDVMSAVNSRFV